MYHIKINPKRETVWLISVVDDELIFTNKTTSFQKPSLMIIKPFLNGPVFYAAWSWCILRFHQLYGCLIPTTFSDWSLNRVLLHFIRRLCAADIELHQRKIDFNCLYWCWVVDVLFLSAIAIASLWSHLWSPSVAWSHDSRGRKIIKLTDRKLKTLMRPSENGLWE